MSAADADNWETIPAQLPAVAAAAADKIRQIRDYDASDAVNGFRIDGLHMWLDKATRVGLVNSISAIETMGGTTVTLWYGTTSMTIPLDVARRLLAALEVYALQCYNTTARHIAAVETLASPAGIDAEIADGQSPIDAITSYDHTAGYPQKPNFTTD